MGRNNKDFTYTARDSRLREGATCSQPDCKEPATNFTWEDGEFCSDCWDRNSTPSRWGSKK